MLKSMRDVSKNSYDTPKTIHCVNPRFFCSINGPFKLCCSALDIPSEIRDEFEKISSATTISASSISEKD